MYNVLQRKNDYYDFQTPMNEEFHEKKRFYVNHAQKLRQLHWALRQVK